MSESYINFPPDTGRKHRTIEKIIDNEIVQEGVFILDRSLKRNILGRYMVATPVVPGTTTSGYCYASIFNPSGSGRLIAIKRLRPMVFAAAAAVYIGITVFRVSAASGGTLLTPSLIAKKDMLLDADPVAEIRHTGVTVTTAARVMSYVSPGAAGHVHFLGGLLDFQEGDEIILRENEGLGLVQEAVGDTDFRVVLFVEWDEFTGSSRL